MIEGETEAFSVICSHADTLHTAFSVSPPESLSSRSSGELRVVYLSMGSAAMAKACTCKWLATDLLLIPPVFEETRGLTDRQSKAKEQSEETQLQLIVDRTSCTRHVEMRNVVTLHYISLVSRPSQTVVGLSTI